MTRLRDIRIGIRNLWTYAPLIWRTREWDHAYLLRFMAFKMNQMACFHKELGHTTDRDRVAFELWRAADHCERIDRENWLTDTAAFCRTWTDAHTEHDLRLLTEEMNDRLLTWWD